MIEKYQYTGIDGKRKEGTLSGIATEFGWNFQDFIKFADRQMMQGITDMDMIITLFEERRAEQEKKEWGKKYPYTGVNGEKKKGTIYSICKEYGWNSVITFIKFFNSQKEQGVTDMDDIIKKFQEKRKQAKAPQIKKGKEELQFEDVLFILGLTPEMYEELLGLGIFSENDTIENAKKKVEQYTKQIRSSAINVGVSLDSTTKKQLRDLAINPEAVEYRMMNNGMSLQEAIDYYCDEGQRNPSYFKFSKNDVLLKHFLLHFGINSDEILNLMRNNYVSLERAFQYVLLKKYVMVMQIISEFLMIFLQIGEMQRH